MKSVTTVVISEKELHQAIAKYIKSRNQSPQTESMKVKLFNGTVEENAFFDRVEVSWENT